jgi:hypothetical protein
MVEASVPLKAAKERWGIRDPIFFSSSTRMSSTRRRTWRPTRSVDVGFSTLCSLIGNHLATLQFASALLFGVYDSPVCPDSSLEVARMHYIRATSSDS